MRTSAGSSTIYLTSLSHPGKAYTHRVVVPQGRGALSRAPLQELYDPSMEASAANLDDLQRSWETLKNVVHHIISCYELN